MTDAIGTAATTLDGVDVRSSAGSVDEPGTRVEIHDSRRKDVFVATLAHELRQPLSAMLGAIEVVRAAPGTRAADRAAALMRRHIVDMSRLVDDLVDAARWARGKVTLHPCRLDLRDVVRDGLEEAETAIAERDQTLVVEAFADSMWVSGDRQRLLQVVSNLLRNAVIYTPRGGRISVSIEATRDLVILRVRDTGCGIDAEALPHVFDLFSQARPQDGIGLGLGLSVVREIVQLHGGSIQALSDGISKGTEFVVSLPVAKGDN